MNELTQQAKRNKLGLIAGTAYAVAFLLAAFVGGFSQALSGFFCSFALFSAVATTVVGANACIIYYPAKDRYVH